MPNTQISKTKLEVSILTKLNNSEQKLLNLNEIGNVKFGDMNNEQKQGLAKCLVKLCYFVGIKEPLSIDNLKMLVYYVVSQHPKFTQEELEQAFFMASSGELGEIEHYQSFSPSYVSKIINTYTAKRSEAVIKYRKMRSEFESEEESQKKGSEYDAVNGLIEVVCAQYDAYLRYEQVMRNEDKMPFEEVRASLAVKMGQKMGFFLDYNSKETAFDFFKRIFDPIPQKNPDEAKKIIALWIKTRIAENTK